MPDANSAALPELRATSAAGEDFEMGERQKPASVGDSDSENLKTVDEKHLQEVEAFEERLARDEASAHEYLVENAHDVAIKVRDSLFRSSFLC